MATTRQSSAEGSAGISREVFRDDYGYAALRLLADASNTEARDLNAESEDALATVRDGLRALSVAAGTRPALAGSPELEPYRHWLEHQVARASAKREPAAESAFAARTPSAAGASDAQLLAAASSDPRCYAVTEAAARIASAACSAGSVPSTGTSPGIRRIHFRW